MAWRKACLANSFCLSKSLQFCCWSRLPARWCWRKGSMGQMVPLNFYLILSAIIFAMGVVGVLIRRNLIVVLMSIELMLNAVNLTFIAFARHLGSMAGQVAVFFVMAVAAAEAVIGLAIIISVFRQTRTRSEERRVGREGRSRWAPYQ